jgi:hypothetical protein
MCAQKAKFLHETLELKHEFNAPAEWLMRLKKQYGVREIAVDRERETLSANGAATECYTIYSVSWALFSINLVMLVRSWRQLLPDV